MNILFSLLLYNPLESFVLIRFCDIFTKRKFNKYDFINCYVLGAINLVVQNFRVVFDNRVNLLFYDLFTAFVPMSILLLIYYNKMCASCKSENINFKISILAQTMNFLAISLMVMFSNTIFGNIFNSNYVSDYYEFIVNILLKIFQIFVIIIINNGVIIYEKHFKETAN